MHRDRDRRSSLACQRAREGAPRNSFRNNSRAPPPAPPPTDENTAARVMKVFISANRSSLERRRVLATRRGISEERKTEARSGIPEGTRLPRNYESPRKLRPLTRPPTNGIRCRRDGT